MAAEAPPRAPAPPHTRLLRALPAGIAVLWIAGVLQFREFDLGPLDFAVLLAAALALHAVLRQARPRPAPIDLPPGTSATTVALLAAVITGAMALVLGGLLESAVPATTGATPWWLRTLWHGACAFAASYCRLLGRVRPAGARASGPGS